MVQLALIAALAALLVIGIVVFKVVAGMLKALLVLAAIAAVVIGLTGGAAVLDAFKLKDKIINQENLMIVTAEDWSSVLSGVTLKVKGNGENENMDVLTEDKISQVNSNYQKKDYKAIQKGYGVLFILNEASLKDALPALAETYNESTEMARQFDASNGQERAKYHVFLIGMKMNSNPLFLIEEFKKGRLQIQPESLAFRAVKLLPLALIKKITFKQAEKVKNQAVEATLGKR